MLTECGNKYTPFDYARKGMKLKKLIDASTEDIKERYKLSHHEIGTLKLIGDSGAGLVLSELCQILDVNKGQESCTVNHLVEKGMVVQNRDPGDRRYIRLALTPEGEKVHKEIEAVMSELHAKMFFGISDEEKMFLHSLAEKIQDNIQAELIKAGL